MVRVREWTEEDLPDVRRILWSTWLVTYASFVPERDLRWYLDTHYTVSLLKELLEKPEVRGYMAEINGCPAGWMRTTLAGDESRLYISSLYVLPERQGKGLGSRLLDEADHVARLHRAEELWLGVMEQNVEAVEWYRKKGFRFIKEEPFTMGECTINHLIGFRSLSGTEQ